MEQWIMDTIEIAEKWINSDVNVIPIRPRSKKPAVAWKRYQSEFVEYPQLIEWFLNTDNNLAVVCGPVSSDLVILDFDDLPQYLMFVHRYPEFENTYTVRTSRGMHVYLFCKNARTRMNDGLDVKANGYCLTYPSVHPSGDVYSVECDKEIMSVDSIPGSTLMTPSTVGCSSVVINNYGSIGTLNVTDNNTKCTRWIEDAASQYKDRGDIIGRIKYKLRITDLFNPVKVFDDGMAFAHCPMSVHPNGDRDPSLSLDLKTDRCQCISRSNCPLHSQRGNDVIDAYRILHGLSFRAALAQMANELGL